MFSDDTLDCVEAMEPYVAQAQPRDAERVEASSGQADEAWRAFRLSHTQQQTARKHLSRTQRRTLDDHWRTMRDQRRRT